jgi:glucokinase
MHTLVGDFGGTNCRLGLARGAQLQAGSVRSYLNAEFPTPGAVIQAYLQQLKPPLSAVCLGVAGPVQDGGVVMTNYPWRLSGPEISGAAGGAPVMFLNDLQAQGYALHGLEQGDLKLLVAGQPQPPQHAPRLIVAIGTGVNAAIAHWQDGRVFVPPSEAGHLEFAAADQTDLQIAQTIRAQLGHCPREAVLSGDGLARLWAFFGGPAGKTGQEVSQALAAGDGAARLAVDRFVTHLARYCADLALAHLPMGGIYLAGSVGLALQEELRTPAFAQAFQRPGPYQPIHRSIAIYAVPQVPLTLRGCAVAAAQEA